MSSPKPDNVQSNDKALTKKKGKHFGAKGGATKFEGEYPELKGHVYDTVGARQADQFVKTTKRIADYFASTQKKAGDFRNAILTLQLPTIDAIPPPTRGDDGTYDEMEKFIFMEQYKKREKKLSDIEELNKTLYSIVWSQCTETMKEKLKRSANFRVFSGETDGISLLQAIKAVSHNVTDTNYLGETLCDALYSLVTCKQTSYMSVQEYHELFMNRVDTYVLIGGHNTASPGMLRLVAEEDDVDVENLDDDQHRTAREMELAVLFLRNADKNRFSGLQSNFKNEFLSRNNKYPKSIDEAYTLLSEWSEPSLRAVTTNANDGVAFAITHDSECKNEDVTLATISGNGSNKGKRSGNKTSNKKVDGSENNTDEPKDKSKDKDDNDSNKKVTSYSSSTTPTTHTPSNHSFHMTSSSIPSTWILLDNQSTIDVFCEASLLTNVHKVTDQMTIHCNAGQVHTNYVGNFGVYGDVWYCEDGIANILSFANMLRKGYSIAYNQCDNTFQVEKSSVPFMTFHQSPSGLFYCDTANGNVLADEATPSHVLVNTVEGNKGKYSNRDVVRATAARDLMIKIGRPSLQQFLTILDKNQLPNCTVTRRDALIAEAIFGKDVGSLKGKTVRKKPLGVSPTLNDLPADIMEHYRNVTLAADIMFVNKIPFIVSISRHIHFGTVEMIANQEPDTILKSLTQVFDIYEQRGFTVTNIHLDGQFECLRTRLAKIQVYLNTTSRGEHVPEAERYIRTLKERTRCIYNSLPFPDMPPRLVIEMVKASNFWLNVFPYSDGISDVLSPRTIVTGSTIDYNHHCQLAFGTYVHTHEDSDNSMAPRTTGALALRPTGNVQGGYYFYSLSTGRVINRNHWTELPMPNDVILRVRNLYRRAKAARGGLDFLDRLGVPIADNDADDDDDESFHPGSVDDDDVDDDGDNAGPDDGNDDDDDDHIIANDAHAAAANVLDVDEVAAPVLIDDHDNMDLQALVDAPVDNVPIDAAIDAEIPGVDANHDAEMPAADVEIPGVDAEGVEVPGVDVADVEIPGVDVPEVPVEHIEHDNAEIAGVDVIDDNTDVATDMDGKYGARSNTYNLRPRRERNFDHLFTTRHEEHLLTQHSVSKGLQIFGEDGAVAVKKELKQLHDLKVIKPVKSKDLTRDQKLQALHYLMFLKKKRCGRIKGRGCADGRKQRAYMSKDETSSPTVSTESLFLSCIIDADENRDVATVDIPGAFLQADLPEDDIVFLRIDGPMVDMLIEIDPDTYAPFKEIHNGKPVLYVRLLKALYGTLQAALLFWQKLSGVLESWGFVLNPYDRCVANKHINGSICTVLWHVDDLKISHVDPDVVTSIIDQLSSEFGADAPLTVHRGKVHDYLGMVIDYSTPKKVHIKMTNYVEQIINEAPDWMNGIAPTPAANHLFTINDTNPCHLSESDAEYFHHAVAQLLFLCKRSRPDIQTAVSFLCTRVQRPDQDDFKKLARVIKYLRHTKNLFLTLEASNAKLQWWVDAAYGVHHDMRSHTGGILSLGKGAVYSTSARQKLNTKSSTEAELVAVNDVLPQALWTKYFLQEQGYDCTATVIHQDNKSAMLLEQNGRASSSKRTRHINIRYYFITDKIKSKEVSIDYCPTDAMVADFFTKPLQGAKFIEFRNFILNLDPPDGTIALCQHAEVPVCFHHGSAFLLHANHRSVLDTQGANHMSDWLLVTRRHSTTRRQSASKNINVVK